MRRPRVWLAALMLCAGGPAAAGSLTVAPTRVDLAGGRTAGAVTLHNNAPEPVLVQVETFAWPRSAATADLEATTRLVAVPPVFSLPPDGKQVIRVALREPHDGAAEEAYRLLITEVPKEGPTGGVQFALRLSLPVFATPEGAVAQPQWSIGGSDGKARLELVNAGTAHVQIQEIRLKSGSGAQQTIGEPSYVLAGQRRSWDLRLPVEAGTTVALEADTSLGKLARSLAAAGR
ncbi:MAG TPA: molecular chaperone [Geminicoccaceae bacterium]|nr:molecular chaperone [Geminicoccus sp.]HMU49061.1 molecular chaperone [Geminicoccaceae bacterium]